MVLTTTFPTIVQRNDDNMELKLVINEAPKIEAFHDAIGIDVVIPATEIAICGIFVWGQRSADLHIYETSLLRTNANMYIKVLQTAVDLADLLHKNDARTLADVKRILQTATKRQGKIKLRLD